MKLEEFIANSSEVKQAGSYVPSAFRRMIKETGGVILDVTEKEWLELLEIFKTSPVITAKKEIAEFITSKSNGVKAESQESETKKKTVSKTESEKSEDSGRK